MTNYVKQKFQWFFDMSTSTTEAQRIDISAGGDDIYQRLSPFFGAFKHFKLGAVRIRMVPAATLPVDPSGLSYEAGEQTVDPRDMFNPGLVRITNGEDIGEIPNAGVDEATYYATMLDKRWFKFRLQAGFKRSAKPLFWAVGQVEQDLYPAMTRNLPKVGSDNSVITDQYTQSGVGDNARSTWDFDNGAPLFQTGQRIRMGWMPTDAFQKVPGYTIGATADAYGVMPIPEVPLITVYLPKAYKTKMYYRVYVEETVMFKDAVAINPYEKYDNSFVQPIDRFVVDSLVKTQPSSSTGNNPSTYLAGGGYE